MYEKSGCSKKYFADKSSLEYSLNAIKITEVLDQFETPTGQLSITFPRPWMIMGLAQAAGTNSDPSIPLGEVTFMFPVDQVAYSDLAITMSIEFMEANKRALTTPFATQYLSGLYRYYFEKYLNEDLKPVFYNSFLFPLGSIKQFWSNANADPSPTLYKDTYEFMSLISDISNKRIWGAPGTYIMEPPTVGLKWTDCMCPDGLVAATHANRQTFIDPPNTPMGGATKCFWWISDAIDDDTNILAGSKVVPYAGDLPDWDAYGTEMPAVVDWITHVTQLATGDMPGIGRYTIEQTNNPTCEECDLPGGQQFTARAWDAYDFGTLALAPGSKFIKVKFANTFAKAPYWDIIQDYLIAKEDYPTLAVLEQNNIG